MLNHIWSTAECQRVLCVLPDCQALCKPWHARLLLEGLICAIIL